MKTVLAALALAITFAGATRSNADSTCSYDEWFYARLSPISGNSAPCSATGSTNCGPAVMPTQPGAGAAAFHQYQYSTAGDGANAYYTVGSFPGATALVGLTNADNTTFRMTNNGTVGLHDALIMKFDGVDAVAWYYTVSGPGNDIAWSVALTPLSDPVVCGQFTGPTAQLQYYWYGQDPPRKWLSNVNGNLDLFVIKLSGVDGTLLWSIQAGGTLDDVATAVFVDSNLITCKRTPPHTASRTLPLSILTPSLSLQM